MEPLTKKERDSLRLKKRYLERREEILEYQKQYRLNCSLKRRETLKRYKRTHKAEVAIYAYNYRTRTKGKIDKTQIHNWTSRVCGICNHPIEGAFHLDHIIPVSRGGKHITDNIQLAHPQCNRLKKNNLVSIWIARRTV